VTTSKDHSYMLRVQEKKHLMSSSAVPFELYVFSVVPHDWSHDYSHVRHATSLSLTILSSFCLQYYLPSDLRSRQTHQMLSQHLLQWPIATFTLKQDPLACKFPSQFRIVAKLPPLPIVSQIVINHKQFWRWQVRRRQLKRSGRHGWHFFRISNREKKWRPWEK